MTESIFRSSEFRRYYAGQALSYLGDGLRTLAIPLLVFHLTGSAVSLGITFALELLPFALFSLIGGSLADRLDRRRLMVGCDALRFAIMAFFAVALWRGFLTLTLIYAGVALLAVCGKDRAKAAVAALVATEQGVNLVAPPLGGAIFGLVGALPALAVNALTYLTSQVSIASVASLGPEAPSGFPRLREIGHDIAAGWRFVTNDPAIQIVGIAFGCFALGSVAGSLIAGKTHWPFGRALLVAYVVDGLLWLPTIWTHSISVAVGAVSICSICGAYQVTAIVSWRMRIIPAEMVGRVFGVIRLFVTIGMFPGSLLGGTFADRLGTRPALAISGFGFLALTVALATARSVRDDRR